jgi:hypothetical protein
MMVGRPDGLRTLRVHCTKANVIRSGRALASRAARAGKSTHTALIIANF